MTLEIIPVTFDGSKDADFARNQEAVAVGLDLA